jgi:acyl-CoA synthetase (AMP-forming)/AMP-acid ligase II
MINSANNFVSLIARHARDRPDHAAFIFLKNGETEEATLTYAQMHWRVMHLATQLTRTGAANGRALLVYPHGLDFIIAFLACLHARAIAVPLPVPQLNDRTGRFSAIQLDAQAQWILTTERLLAELPHYFTGAPSFLATDVSYALNTEGGGWSADSDADPAAIAFLQYTSGSTGQPKGVAVSHLNLMHNQSMIKQAFGTSKDTISVSWIPSYHDMGLIGSILGSIHSGTTCVMMSPMSFVQKPIRWLRAISRYRATTSGAPNFAYDLCAQKIRPEQMEGLDLNSWSLAFCGAEPVRSDTIERFSGRFGSVGFRRESFYPCYGLAEATLLVAGPCGGEGPTVRSFSRSSIESGVVREACVHNMQNDMINLVACGQAWGGQTMRIVNPVTLAPCAADEVGEIWLAGPSVAKGYWNAGDESQAVFAAQLSDDSSQRFLRTGDLGFVLDHQLFVAGRLKDVIIIKGRNHYPSDLESSAYGADPALRQDGCAAFSITTELGESVVVIQEIERRQIPGANFPALQASIRSRIVRVHRLDIADVLIVPPASLPRTSSGKIRRGECKKRYLESHFSDCVMR